MVLFYASVFFAQVPQGINYQAVARDQAGNPLKNEALTVRISILQGGPDGTVVWEEDHQVTTNAFGMFTLVIGDPLATPGNGSLDSFDKIDWSLGDYYLQVALDDGTGFQYYDPVPFLSVPYARVAEHVEGGWQNIADTLVYTSGSIAIGTESPNGSKLAVQGDDVASGAPLFEVKRKDGQTVFAVYNDSIRMYVKATPGKNPRGGFAIGGFGMTKGEPQTLMFISPDSARIYIDQSDSKRPRGGFAIGGFGMTKGGTTQLMSLTKENYFIGHESGKNITTGIYNQFFGYQAGMNVTEGSNNVFLGYQAGLSGGNAAGSNNVFLGTRSGVSNVYGSDNIFLGDSSGASSVSGDKNVYIGTQSGKSSVGGDENIYIGWRSGYLGGGSQNICIGNYSGYSNQSGQNLFIGEYAGEKNTSGTRNSFVGFFAGQSNVTGNQNTYLGQFAGMDNLNSFNTYIGYWSGGKNVNGQKNSFLGYRSGQGTTGSYNVFMGYKAGEGNQGSGNVFIGYMAGAYSGSRSNVLYIDNSSTAAPLIYGDFSTNKVTIHDVLRLAPRDSAPDNPQEGELYVNIKNHHIYCYLQGGWRQLD